MKMNRTSYVHMNIALMCISIIGIVISVFEKGIPIFLPFVTLFFMTLYVFTGNDIVRIGAWVWAAGTCTMLLVGFFLTSGSIAVLENSKDIQNANHFGIQLGICFLLNFIFIFVGHYLRKSFMTAKE